MIRWKIVGQAELVSRGKKGVKAPCCQGKGSCDQVSLNRIQDVIFELRYPHQGKKRDGEKIRKKTKVKKKQAMKRKVKEEEEGGECNFADCLFIEISLLF